ncbi:MAG: ABC transporter permease [Firmicutes bacterium]|nr:ABC transporter permease [Bacillota bacterium]
MLENIRLAFHGIWAHKLRSGLTMLGIIIGIAAIIAIVSTIQGTNEQIKQNLIGAGNNSVTVQLYDGDYPIDLSYYTLPSGIPVITQDVKDEIGKLREVSAVSLFTSRYINNSVFNGNLPLDSGRVLGVDADYFNVFSYSLLRGRSFVQSDYDLCRKVVILDDTAAKILFPDSSPLDRTLEIMGEPFVVIGVVMQGSAFTPTYDTIQDYYNSVNSGATSTGGGVFIPNRAWPIVFQFDEPQSVAVKAVNTDSMTNAGKQTADILNARLSLPEGSTLTYKSQDLLEKARQMQDLASATNRQLILVACISLVVGGIGVMNIMMVSVTERIREIGLKKALGAKKRVILFQFLTEAVTLTSVGGFIGVLAGIVLAEVMSRMSQTLVYISVPFIVIGVLFSMLIGVLFGVFPAVKAANQNPIDALRQQ